jgi:hypothetical protein
MSSPLTLENSLILACVRTEPDVQRIHELVERSPEWPVIVRKAEQWRLVTSVYLQLRRGAQPGRHLYYRDTIRGVAKRELLRAALLRFAEASVPVIVLKGAALATLVYQSHALRPIGALRQSTLLGRRQCALRLHKGTALGGRRRIELATHLADRVAGLLRRR